MENKVGEIKKEQYCMNCDKEGHIMKNCTNAITSFGVILMSLNVDNNIRDSISKLSGNFSTKECSISIESPNDIELFCSVKDQIKFLLIRRKHTLGFLEFMRGRYNVENIDGIIFLFKQMTSEEIDKIKNMAYNDFDELWTNVWGNNKKTQMFHNEYIKSKDKITQLIDEKNGYLPLSFYVNNVIPLWDCPEWGFPKGRRNYKENDKICAVREFKEETGYEDDDFIMMNDLCSIEENLIGTNGINYKHIYYLAIACNDKDPIVDTTNKMQVKEIGDIGYFSYNECIKKIRPYHTDRIKIITDTYVYMINSIIDYAKKLIKENAELTNIV